MCERRMLEEHVSVSEVRAACRAEPDAVRRSHLQVIWLLLSGDAVPEVARATGFMERWILKLIDRWNTGGMVALGDRRRGNAGAKPLLDATGLVALAAALEGSPPDGGLWSDR